MADVVELLRGVPARVVDQQLLPARVVELRNIVDFAVDQQPRVSLDAVLRQFVLGDESLRLQLAFADIFRDNHFLFLSSAAEFANEEVFHLFFR